MLNCKRLKVWSLLCFEFGWLEIWHFSGKFYFTNTTRYLSFISLSTYSSYYYLNLSVCFLLLRRHKLSWRTLLSWQTYSIFSRLFSLVRLGSFVVSCIFISNLYDMHRWFSYIWVFFIFMFGSYRYRQVWHKIRHIICFRWVVFHWSWRMTILIFHVTMVRFSLFLLASNED